MSILKKWKVLSTRDIFRTRIFRLKADECELSTGRIMPAYYTLEFPDWVNVVALTPENKIVMVRQYRHSIQDFTLEFPGGTTDGAHESPETAAQRELEEETGYTTSDLELAGVHHPNPALQSNRLYTYIAKNCRLTQSQNLDPFEDIEVIEMSFEEVSAKIESGEINHSLIIAGFHLAVQKLHYFNKKS